MCAHDKLLPENFPLDVDDAVTERLISDAERRLVNVKLMMLICIACAFGKAYTNCVADGYMPASNLITSNCCFGSLLHRAF